MMRVTDVAAAVGRLKAKYPLMAVDKLQADEPQTVDEIVVDVFCNLSQVEECALWLAQCHPVARFNRRQDTYSYKHEVERHAGHWLSHTSLLVAIELAELDMIQDPTRPWAGLLKLGADRPGRT